MRYFTGGFKKHIRAVLSPRGVFLGIAVMLSLWKNMLLSPSEAIVGQLQKNNMRWRDGFFNLSLAFMLAIPLVYLLSQISASFSSPAQPDHQYSIMPLVVQSFWLLLLGLFAEAFLINMGGGMVCGQSSAKKVFCLLAAFSSPLALLNLPYFVISVLQIDAWPLSFSLWLFSLALSIYAAYFTFILMKSVYSLGSTNAIIAFFISLAIPAIFAVLLLSIAFLGTLLDKSPKVAAVPESQLDKAVGAPLIAQSDEYWATYARPFAIASHRVSTAGIGEIEIRNTGQKTLVLNRIEIDHAKLSLVEQFIPGETKRIRISGLPEGSRGQYYSFSLNMVYMLPSGIENSQVGAFDLLGKYG